MPEATKSLTEIKLPSTIDDLAIGGSGRYLILHLDYLNKLAIFDVDTRKFKYVNVPGNVFFAAGQSKLIVAEVESNILRRYDLGTLELELSVQSPLRDLTAKLKSLTMGCNSDGPVLAYLKEPQQTYPRNIVRIIDIQRLTCREFATESIDIKNMIRHIDALAGDLGLHIRASGDGTVFGVWRNFHSPDMCTIVINNMTQVGGYTTFARSEQVTSVIPDAHGDRIYQAGEVYSNVYSNSFKNMQQQLPPQHMFLPSPQGGWFLGIPITPENSSSAVHGNQSRPVLVFANGENSPLVAAFQSDSEAFEVLPMNDFTIDKRYHYLPRSHLIITIPKENDRLILHHFNLIETLKAAGKDYLFISSVPCRTALVNKPYSYKIAVLSSRGGIKFALDSGPKGMQLSAEGELSWTPGDASENGVGIIVLVSDALGRQIFHTFNLDVH